MKYLKLKFLLMFFTLAMAIPPAWAEEVTVTKTVADLVTQYNWDISTSVNGTTNLGTLATDFNLDNNINISTTGEPNCGSIWGTGASQWRLYQNRGGNIIVTANNGCTLTSVTFTFTISSSGTLIDASSETVVSGTAVEVSGTTATFTVGNTGTATNGQVRVTKFSVTYETPDTPQPTTPWLTFTPEKLTIGEGGGTLTVNGNKLSSDPGVFRVDEGDSNQFLATLQGVNQGQTWFPRVTNDELDNGVSDQKVVVTYDGRELTATGKFGVASDNASAYSIVTYQPDLYIYCDLVDGQSWRYYPDEPQMTYADGVYTKTVTITNPGSCILFARAAGLTYNWDDSRQFFGAKWDSDWVYGVDNSKYIANYGSGSSQGKNQYYPIKFNQTGVYTITIDPEAMEFTVTKTSVDNIAAAQAFTGDTFTFMGEAVVTYQHGQNLWIRDASGSGLIYGSLDDTFENGEKVAAGWTAENEMYNNYVPRFKNPKNISKGQGTADAAPIPLSTLNRDRDVNKYASMSGVTITRVDGQNYYFEVENTEYCLRDNYYLFDDLEVDHVYDVEGVVSVYNGNPQLYLTKVEDVTPKVLTVTLESETTSATAGVTIPVTVKVENAEGDYTVTYKIGENGTETTLTGDVINVTSQTAGEVKLYVTVTNNGNEAHAEGTYTFTEPVIGSNVFTKVTKTEELVAGKRYIFVYGNWAMGTAPNGNFLTPISITGGDEVEVDNDVAIMTLGGTSGHYTFALGDQYLYAVNSTSLGFGDETEWSIAQDSNDANDKGFRAKHANYSRAVKKHNSMERFGNYSTTDNNSSYAWIYVEKTTAPQPEPLAITLTPAPEQPYTVGDNVTVTATVANGSESTEVTYKIGEGEWQNYPEGGIVLPNTAAGDVVVTVKATDGTNEATDEVTYHFNAAKAFEITLTATPAQETYKVNDVVNVKVAVANALVENPTITYTIGETREAATYDPETGINVTSATAGTVKLTVNVTDGYEHAGENTATADYVFVKKDATLSFGETTSFTVYAGNDFTAPELTTDPEGLAPITYSIEGNDPEIVLFDEEDGTVVVGDKTGTVTITATFAGNDTYNKATASYTLNIIEKKVATLSFDVEGITVYPNAEDFIQPKLTTTPENLTVTYTSTDDNIATVVDGVLMIGDKTGTATITATFAGNDTYGTATASYTVTVEPRPIVVADEGVEFELYVGQTQTKTFDVTGDNLKGDITLTLNDETSFYSIEPTTIRMDDAENATVTVTYAPTTEGIHEATVTLSTKDAEENVTVTLTGMAEVQPVVAAPTFSLVAGTYGKAQQLYITAESGATILYSTDGSEPTTPYNGAIDLGQGTTTVKAVATKDGFAKSPVVTATYIIDIPKELPTITPFKGYYQIKNNGNGKYANIAGRKTLNFTDAPADKAGTVIWLETNDKGQVQSLRSQAADLQGYANRAMRYVPQMVDIVVNKINQMEGIEDATGAGSVLGENGLDAIMEKFNECFDYHLYVEQAQGGWRLYGKTPNMQHVVDFYRDHKDQVEAKLPKLEQFINDALHKLINKIGGSTVFTDFSLHQIWKNMGGTLTEPVDEDEASIMAFYREVLNNKNYVWDFAYQTAQIYWGNVKSHPRYDELKAQLGEYADYIDEFVTQVRPDFKYYVIQRGDEPDYISQGNGEIINNDPRTLWTLEPRTDFTVNIAGEQFGCPYAGGVGGYATTNYTDFAYTVPEGVTAYKVASVENGVANLQALSGVIPAQTPVLLMAKEAKDYVLTLSTEAGTAVEGNLLVGPDYLIKTYELKTPMVESLFSLAKGVLGEQLYNQYVAQYEYLQLLYAGTVNNKYFWGLTRDDVMKCLNANGDDCVVRDLSGSKFIDNRQVKTNKAFLVSETDQTITISTLRGDVNHDGYVNIDDVTALIDYLLEVDGRACPYCANVNCDSTVNIVDVTYLIDILLGNISPYAEGGNGN